MKKAGKGWSLGLQFVPRKQCALCGSSFYAPPSQTKRGGGLYCSRKCAAISIAKTKDKRVNIPCKNCGKLMRVPPCRENRVRHCSKECAIKTRAKKRTDKMTGFCMHCGKIIQSQRKYCSIKCVNIDKIRKHVDLRPVAKCQSCGKEYRVNPGSHGVVCSLPCWYKIKTLKTKGTMHPTGKGGKRKDLGNVYFRSRWEANWARYLNFLLQNRIIKKWDFEPETFEFHDIKKGNRFYTPDFRVVLSDDRVVYHEVKGWMTPKSETKIKRFRKRYPNHQLEVVDRVRYRAIARQLGNYLPNWEICESHGKY